MQQNLIFDMSQFLIFSILFAVIVTVVLVLAVMHHAKAEKLNIPKRAEVDFKVAEEILRRIDNAETKRQVKMVVRDLEPDKPAIRFVNFRKYLELAGWILDGHGRFILIYKMLGAEKFDILIPADETLPEYNDMIYNTILTVADVDGKDFLDLFKYLSAVKLGSINLKSIKDLGIN